MSYNHIALNLSDLCRLKPRMGTSRKSAISPSASQTFMARAAMPFERILNIASSQNASSNHIWKVTVLTSSVGRRSFSPSLNAMHASFRQ